MVFHGLPWPSIDLPQGEEGSTFYIISEGKAIVTKDDKNYPDRGKEVAQIFAGQYFGERAILRSEVRMASGNVISCCLTTRCCLPAI